MSYVADLDMVASAGLELQASDLASSHVDTSEAVALGIWVAHLDALVETVASFPASEVSLRTTVLSQGTSAVLGFAAGRLELTLGTASLELTQGVLVLACQAFHMKLQLVVLVCPLEAILGHREAVGMFQACTDCLEALLPLATSA